MSENLLRVALKYYHQKRKQKKKIGGDRFITEVKGERIFIIYIYNKPSLPTHILSVSQFYQLYFQ